LSDSRQWRNLDRIAGPGDTWIRANPLGSGVAIRVFGPMFRIQRTTDGAAVVLTVSGQLDAGNVSDLSATLNGIGAGAAVVLDLTDLILADREVVRLLKAYEARDGVVLRNCPAFIRIWMAADDN
jgi:hypothetical protein